MFLAIHNLYWCLTSRGMQVVKFNNLLIFHLFEQMPHQECTTHLQKLYHPGVTRLTNTTLLPSAHMTTPRGGAGNTLTTPRGRDGPPLPAICAKDGWARLRPIDAEHIIQFWQRIPRFWQTNPQILATPSPEYGRQIPRLWH